jgi:hypothetical protein
MAAAGALQMIVAAAAEELAVLAALTPCISTAVQVVLLEEQAPLEVVGVARLVLLQLEIAAQVAQLQVLAVPP